MDIKTIIENKINAAGLTKKEVAERMGIIPNNINAMIASPSWPTLEKLSNALGVPVSELVSDAPQPEPLQENEAVFTIPKGVGKVTIRVEQ